MIKIKQLFKKVINSVKKMFFKNKVNMLPEGQAGYQENIESESKWEEFNRSEENEIYENVKKGKIPLNSLLITDLIKVLAISKEELNVEDENFKKIKTESSQINDKLKILESKKQGFLSNT